MVNKYTYILFTVFLLFFSVKNVSSQDSVYQKGIASFYAENFVGKITASGEIYKPEKLTAAHRDLPFGTFAKITNLENSKTVVVVINDRGPYVGDRIIDLSRKAAAKLEYIEKGTTEVYIEIVEEGYNVAKQQNISTKKAEVSKKEYYKLVAEKHSPSGYGVQIASYAEIANLMIIANSVNSTIKKDLTIQVIDVQGSKIYRLIVGIYKTREEANKYLKTIKKHYPDCFVIKF